MLKILAALLTILTCIKNTPTQYTYVINKEQQNLYQNSNNVEPSDSLCNQIFSDYVLELTNDNITYDQTIDISANRYVEVLIQKN